MRLLGTTIVEKLWGKDVLPPQFDAPAGKRIGEVWFKPPPELPEILVKYIFTSEKLSVQVHPSDDQAKALGETDRGKDECWLVLDAEPGAALGIGFKTLIDAGAIRRAALDGTIEDLMQWFPVKPGDFYYIPAGTVHAIGAGVSLVEIQQNSDITYRLYDYGRQRELHLDKAVQVANVTPYVPDIYRRIVANGATCLVDGRFFKVEIFDQSENASAEDRRGGPRLVLPIDGAVSLGDGVVVPVGQCGYAATAEQIVATGTARWIAISAV